MDEVRRGREEHVAPTAVSVIEILGPGCSRCYETHRVVKHVVEEAGIQCLVQKSESVDRMVELGVLRTPAVAFDGRVVHQGSIPKSEDVRRLLGLT
jgi:small redox-active disulfide protein 2